jgi:hypothetical protein
MLTSAQIISWGDAYCLHRYPELEFVPKEHEEPHMPVKKLCPIPTNGDVAGVGVRLSTYVVQFSLLILTCFNPRMAARMRTKAQTISVIIVVATLVCSAIKKISLPHALIALGMTSVSIWPAFLVDPLRDASPKSLVLAKSRFLVYTIVSLWINVAPTCFGSNYPCNYATTRFAIRWARGYMAVNPTARATWLRVHFTLIVFACGRFLMHPGPMFWLKIWPASRSARYSRGWTKAETHSRLTELEYFGRDAGKFGKVFFRWLFDSSPSPPMPWFAYGNFSWQQRTRIFLTNHNFFRFVVATVVFAHLVSENEFLVVLNLGQWENRSWGFGQTLACAQALEFARAVVVAMVNKDKWLIECWQTGAFNQARYEALQEEAERELREREAAEMQARRDAARRVLDVDANNSTIGLVSPNVDDHNRTVDPISVNTGTLAPQQASIRSRASSTVSTMRGDGVSTHSLV